VLKDEGALARPIQIRHWLQQCWLGLLKLNILKFKTVSYGTMAGMLTKIVCII